ncbi:hypothetical protein SPHINGOAX6_70916 [Sphingomonas sp. AX6]|nr:hypothetical protein SPHINGOAX6_70916 [Sphingomonas sp. AX6]
MPGSTGRQMLRQEALTLRERHSGPRHYGRGDGGGSERYFISRAIAFLVVGP